MKERDHHRPTSSPPTEPGYPEHPEVTQAAHSETARHPPDQHADGSHAGHGTMGSATPDNTHAGHVKHAGHSVAMFRDKFWISLLLTIPTLIWGHMLPRALGYSPPAVPGQRWIAPVFG